MTVQEEQRSRDQVVLARTPWAVAVLAADAAATEAQGRPTARSLQAVTDLGGFALAVPRAPGGDIADLTTIARVVMELGSACPATAWVVGTSSTSRRFLSLGLRGDALAEASREPDAQFCGSGAPHGQARPTPGGVLVSGRWPMVSGCESASTVVLGVMHHGGEDSPPVYSVVHLPTTHVQIERTWDTAGLRGTGSHTVVARDAFVPSAAVGAVSATARFVISSSVDVLAPLIGAAQAALALTGELFGSRKAPVGTKHSRMSESPGARQLLAEATQLVDSARRRLLDVCADVDGSWVDTALTSIRASAARIELATAAHEIREALEKVLDLHGAGGFAVDNPLQRFWRDVSVGTRHPLLKAFPIVEEHGALLASSAVSAA